MFLQVDITDFRILERFTFRPVAGVQLVTGANGVGKTSLLEAMHVAATGRSFRHADPAPLIRQGRPHADIVCRFRDRFGQTHVLGTRRYPKNLEVRLDGRRSVRRSEIIQALPVLTIDADPHELLDGSPDRRRQFLDHGGFHVEHDHLTALQRYARVLDQRNRALHTGTTEPGLWDPQLEELAERIDGFRRRTVVAVMEGARRWLARWSFPIDVQWRWRRGWPQELTLREALSRNAVTDRKRGFTGHGPHRADLQVLAPAGNGKRVFSRGQAKLVVVAMYLALAERMAAAGRKPVLLFDDLPAELDATNRSRLLEAIGETFEQAIVTCLDAGDLPVAPVSAVFHVEHGSRSPVSS